MPEIYLDNAATTAMDPRVIAAMQPYLTEEYYNPSAAYSDAKRVGSMISDAAAKCGALIGADRHEIVFTSGGTESDNAAIMGVYEYHMAHGGGSFHMITADTEHPAVLNTCRRLQNLGAEVTYVKPDTQGFISPQAISAACRPDTRLVSIMTVNNETGVIADVRTIGQIAHQNGALFHTDAVQAYGKMPIDVRSMNIDLLSASAHKLHGPKGVGLLYVRRDTDLASFITGGGQQEGMRSGTENTAGIAGFGEAALCATGLTSSDHVRELSEHMIERFLNEVPDAILNGPESGDMRLPEIVNMSFADIDASSLLISLDIRGICCSTGSACNASSDRPSHVLSSMGYTDERIKGSLRLSLSRMTTREEADRAVGIIATEIAAQRLMGLGLI